MTPGTFADLFKVRDEIDQAYHKLLIEAGKRLRTARGDIPILKYEALLGLARNTYNIAEIPRIDKPSKRFSLERVAEIYSATVIAREALQKFSDATADIPSTDPPPPDKRKRLRSRPPSS